MSFIRRTVIAYCSKIFDSEKDCLDWFKELSKTSLIVANYRECCKFDDGDRLIKCFWKLWFLREQTNLAIPVDYDFWALHLFDFDMKKYQTIYGAKDEILSVYNYIKDDYLDLRIFFSEFKTGKTLYKNDNLIDSLKRMYEFVRQEV